ncbi:hypothetical protein N7510_011727 [Penicillium lagena]|uniref:uncharacterized protein n=1 Tax=Penicillium lagena TaxID=94218 RepID=UPI00254058AC|nr:uncharacterized protein N7510_011727 [Penicillium lagena]KAJ5602193.1 hypothetical protein N7510_011727 [Penicillium lagena]
MTNHDTPSFSRKRRRPALSCEQCRRRKVRCDREMPCGPCRKTRPALACSYVHEGKAVLDARLGSSAIDEDEPELRVPCTQRASLDARNGYVDGARPAQFEHSVRMLQDRVENLEHGIPANPSRDCRYTKDDISGITHLLNELDNRVNELERNSRPDRQPSSRTLIPPLVPFLKFQGDKTEFFGSTHWAHMFQQLHYLRDFRRTASHAETDVGNLLRETHSMRSIIKSWQAPPLIDPVPCLLEDLPPKDECDQLVKCYLRTLEITFRVLHIPSFYEDYAKFWKHTQSASKAFLLKLLLVLAIGSIFHSNPGPTNDLRLPIRRWVHAAQWWLTGPTSKETRNLEALQVHCLLLLCRHAYAIDKQATWNSAGSLLRLAMGQGLHRDPGHFPSISPFEGEMRRRIWVTILELNVQFSSDVSMPPLLTLHGFDTKPPSNLNDEDFAKCSKSLPSPKPKDRYTSSALQIALLRSFSTRLHISQVLNDCNNDQSYEAALDCGTELRTASNELAELFHGYFAQTAGSDSGPTLFHYRLLNTLLHRTLLNHYRPFALKAIQDPLFYLSRKLSLDSALVIASYAENPNSPDTISQQATQDFHRLCLSGAGLFKGPFSEDVIVTIGLELMLQTEETLSREPTCLNEEAPGAIDQMAQYTRAPLVLALERIQSILCQSISAGIPSMKRYCLLSGILAQAQAAHHGDSGKNAVIRQALLKSMRTCRSSLQEFIAHEMNNASTDGTLADEDMNRSSSEGAIASSLSPGFWVSS